jgi:hypothetical protein
MGFSGVFIAKKLKINQASHDKAHFFSSLLGFDKLNGATLQTDRQF